MSFPSNSTYSKSNYNKLFLKTDIAIFIILILALVGYYFYLFATKNDWTTSLGDILYVGILYILIILPYTIISYISHFFFNLKVKSYNFFKQRLVLFLIYLFVAIYFLIRNSSPESIYILTVFILTLPISPLILSIYQFKTQY